MTDIIHAEETPRGAITATISAQLVERGVLVTIGAHAYILDLDTAKDLRDKLKVAIGSVE